MDSKGFFGGVGKTCIGFSREAESKLVIEDSRWSCCVVLIYIGDSLFCIVILELIYLFMYSFNVLNEAVAVASADLLFMYSFCN